MLFTSANEVTFSPPTFCLSVGIIEKTADELWRLFSGAEGCVTISERLDLAVSRIATLIRGF